jgi:hypothetical protein
MDTYHGTRTLDAPVCTLKAGVPWEQRGRSEPGRSPAASCKVLESLRHRDTSRRQCGASEGPYPGMSVVWFADGEVGGGRYRLGLLGATKVAMSFRVG